MVWSVVSKKRLRSSRGFTVIEVAVALSLLGIGLMALAAMIPATKMDLNRSNLRSRATFAAQQSAEWLHGMPYADSLLTAGIHTWEETDEQGLERSWTVEDDVPLTGVKRVTLAIRRNGSYDEAARVVFLYAESGR